MGDEPPTQSNGTSALAKLLNQLNLPTLALILITGGGNWFATKSTSDEQRAIVVRQVKDLHDALDDFEKRQKSVLENQSRILDNQTRMLQEIHKQP